MHQEARHRARKTTTLQLSDWPDSSCPKFFSYPELGFLFSWQKIVATAPDSTLMLQAGRRGKHGLAEVLFQLVVCLGKCAIPRPLPTCFGLELSCKYVVTPGCKRGLGKSFGRNMMSRLG